MVPNDGFENAFAAIIVDCERPDSTRAEELRQCGRQVKRRSVKF